MTFSIFFYDTAVYWLKGRKPWDDYEPLMLPRMFLVMTVNSWPLYDVDRDRCQTS
jgi:hypothetical protein